MTTMRVDDADAIAVMRYVGWWRVPYLIKLFMLPTA